MGGGSDARVEKGLERNPNYTAYLIDIYSRRVFETSVAEINNTRECHNVYCNYSSSVSA